MNSTPLKEFDWWPHGRIREGLCIICDWSNCGGHHLVLKMPCGRWFDTGQRASNCLWPDNKEHRCWNVWGDTPPYFTIDNKGYSCPTGGGSILTNYPPQHLFLRNGLWIDDGWWPEGRPKY